MCSISTTFTPKSKDENIVKEQENLSIYEIIENKVIPKWKEYIISKTNRKSASLSAKPRIDTFKKKILRDVREFFRILFRVRFHYLQHKNLEGIQTWTQKFFEELHLNPTEDDLEDFHLFRYIHQTHLCTSLKVMDKGSTLDQSPFKVIDSYNEGSYIKFLSHPLCAKMFYFVLSSFKHIYYPLVFASGMQKPQLEEEVKFKLWQKERENKMKILEIVSMLLNCYRKMKNEGEMDRIEHMNIKN